MLDWVGRIFGDVAYLMYSVFWNTSFMPHSPRAEYPDWAFGILNFIIFISGISALMSAAGSRPKHTSPE